MFLLQNATVLVLALLAAAGAGTLVLPRERLALRSAVGLAMLAHACFVLALLGQLKPLPLILLECGGIAAAFYRGGTAAAPRLCRVLKSGGFAAALQIPLFALALLPPLAFDETLYHLPFVQAFARDGALRFLPELRFPVFPVLQELLSVPAFLLAGDTGPHLIALAEAIVLAGLLVEWGGRRAGWLAAALLLGSPLIVHLATVLYVDIALALFVAAGFYALQRERYGLAAFLLGTACSVKYLGFYFAFAALVLALARRRGARFAAVCALTALPMTLWIFANTHDPLFPFLVASDWSLPAQPSLPMSERATRIARLLFDVTFARDRVGWQPPVTPFLVLIVWFVRERWLVAMSLAYVAIFTFLPQDARYLVPLLPLLCIAAARAIAQRWPRLAMPLAVLAIAPGLAYTVYRLYAPPQIAGVDALQQAGTARVYNCGAERLKSYARGTYLGDLNGPFAYERILSGANTTRELAERLRAIDVRFYLLDRNKCASPAPNGGMQLVYEDAGAQLWRVVTPAPSSDRAADAPPLPPAGAASRRPAGPRASSTNGA